MQLNQVMVYVSNLERSITFYQTLGLTLIVKSPHYARFLVSGNEATFPLHLTDEPIESKTVIYFETTELDAQVSIWKSKGILPDGAMPEMQPWLWREIHFTDPDGNPLCLYYAGENRINPPWRIN